MHTEKYTAVLAIYEQEEICDVFKILLQTSFTTSNNVDNNVFENHNLTYTKSVLEILI